MARSSGETRYIVTEETQSWFSLASSWIDFDFEKLTHDFNDGLSTAKTVVVIMFAVFILLMLVRLFLYYVRLNHYVGSK